MEKLLPRNVEAEAGVLGSILINPEALHALDFLRADDFYHNAHRTIYEEVSALSSRAIPPDFITLCDALEQRSKLEEVGGAGYIASLVEQVPTSSNAEFYGRIVLRTSQLRDLIDAAGQIAAIAYEEAPDALEQAERLLYALARRRLVSGESERLATLAPAYLGDLDRLYMERTTLTGVPTGYTDLDRLTGGFQKSDLLILASRPGVGKTALALCLARNAARKHARVGFFSLEMSKQQLLTRLMSIETGIDSQYLRSGRIADFEWDAIVAAETRLEELPIWIDDTAALSTTALRSRARRMCAEHQVDLLIVDYLQLLQARDERGRRYDNDVQETTEISHALKALAKELGVPILAVSQLNRAVEGRAEKRPQLSDLRQSGALEQDADVVLFLYREELYSETAPKGAAQVIIAKHRNGPTGDIDLHFEAAQTRFLDEV